ncbi:hypothetical protein EZV73_09750 [Acidaminobacter sp. JC074]|uniref:AAA family ATPase n=1 Tax=Acidaminobacter sp. JC074 TaxID=2530199 RepID=UPI001F0EE02E|nr:AAA family ATPase [Acidaminobacter sp. JC074]MCH4887857.1 hypothetical protein [Acidaminobacter sp. JC074]
MRIHIVGASGAGSTTLANALSNQLNIKALDSDDYLWLKTEPPFQTKRDLSKRVSMLENDFKVYQSYILSGSIYDWGDELLECFDLIVFLWLPPEIRIKRLINRDYERYGDLIEVGNAHYDMHKAFIDWASMYDQGDTNIRSRKSHELWLKKATCKVLRIEGDFEVDKKIEMILDFIEGDSCK